MRLRLGDEVTFEETPHLGHRGEKITQEGYIHSFDREERGDTKARCAYKKHAGYLSAEIALSDLSLVPRQPQHGSSSRAGGAGSSSGAATAVGKGKHPKGSSLLGGKGSSSAGAAASSGRSVRSWGDGRCEHVAAGVECNHKNGKVRKAVGFVCGVFASVFVS